MIIKRVIQSICYKKIKGAALDLSRLKTSNIELQGNFKMKDILLKINRIF